VARGHTSELDGRRRVKLFAFVLLVPCFLFAGSVLGVEGGDALDGRFGCLMGCGMFLDYGSGEGMHSG
jgi:hypothetical protein